MSRIHGYGYARELWELFDALHRQWETNDIQGR